ncbi:5-oxoprolinase subunit PxpB [Colwellia echini]|uniref:5-oxoprolinase subunit PxpB n=2 Tax=Colwellia echini TaxID=1982103 RepID=A0ABY3MUE5_9GAMM|nr:5-oxoprolinase subunit PxpB [Colwellia echini]
MNTSTQINEHIRLDIAGENVLILYFTELDFTEHDLTLGANEDKKEPSSNNILQSGISETVNSQVQQTVVLLRQHLANEIIDLIPSYASVLVMFDLLKTDHHQLRLKLQQLLKSCTIAPEQQGRLIELPAYYSLESGMDLPRIAKQAKLSVEQVIHLHQAQEYRVYAIGFAPGFAYLGEVDERIAMSRLATPRLTVPKGAIAIADRQTAVYPAQSPGGWNIIGLCPTDMFNAKAEPIMPVAVGDRVKFVAITKQQFLSLGGKLAD